MNADAGIAINFWICLENSKTRSGFLETMKERYIFEKLLSAPIMVGFFVLMAYQPL